MKFIICLLALSAVTVALDTKSIRPIWQMPEFRDQHPELLRKYESNNQDISNFIVGGELAEVNQFPYSVGIIVHMASGNAWCSGSVISDQYILTAAHCTTNIPSVIVLVRAHNISNPLEPGQQRIFTEDITTHPNYISAQGLNDISLIRLPTPLVFTETFRPIRLPNRRQESTTFANQLGTVVGWGTISDSSSSIQSVPSFTRNPIITNFICQLNLLVTIEDTHLCMSGAEGRNPCAGDSGAPLTITEADGTTCQVGLYSFGSITGCERGRPSVFTRITSYFDWIENNSNVKIRSGWD